jgi:hypothetical protein
MTSINLLCWSQKTQASSVDWGSHIEFKKTMKRHFIIWMRHLKENLMKKSLWFKEATSTWTSKTTPKPSTTFPKPWSKERMIRKSYTGADSPIIATNSLKMPSMTC